MLGLISFLLAVVMILCVIYWFIYPQRRLAFFATGSVAMSILCLLNYYFGKNIDDVTKSEMEFLFWIGIVGLIISFFLFMKSIPAKNTRSKNQYLIVKLK
jgi:hypothetical protein